MTLTQQSNFSKRQSSKRWYAIKLVLVAKGSTIQRIQQKVIFWLYEPCDPDLEDTASISLHHTLAHDAPPYHVWLKKVEQFRRYCPDKPWTHTDKQTQRFEHTLLNFVMGVYTDWEQAQGMMEIMQEAEKWWKRCNLYETSINKSSQMGGGGREGGLSLCVCRCSLRLQM